MAGIKENLDKRKRIWAYRTELRIIGMQMAQIKNDYYDKIISISTILVPISDKIGPINRALIKDMV